MRCLIAAVFSLLASASLADDHVVWQIGTPDHSYAEFALAGDYHAYAQTFGTRSVVFQIGRSNAARDWPFIQPGPVDHWAPAYGRPWTIRFELTGEPQGVFTLRIELADVQKRSPPLYTVSINGGSGSYQLAPGGGDGSLQNPRQGKPQKLEITVPAAVLKKGANEIRLACAEGSWVQYDAITLLANPQGAMRPAEIQSITARPTPFFLRRNGQVRRAVDVLVAVTGAPGEVHLGVEAAGQASEMCTARSSLIGSIHEEIDVADSSTPLDVKITATLGRQVKTTTVRVMPRRKWRVYVAASSHTDIGYTAIQYQCAERHNENIDRAVELIQRCPEFRWNLEVAWQAENYVGARGGRQLDEFFRMVRQGKIGVQALYANLLTGLCSHEAACRFTWFAHRLGRQLGVPLSSAMISDVPSQEASVPMLLAGAGIRYFSSGINNDRAYPFAQMQLRCPCWWEGPDGSRVLMMYTFQYAQAAQWALNQSFDAARARVMDKLAQYDQRSDYPYDAIFLHGAVSDNCPLDARLAEVVHQWNERYEYPKLILSRNAEFYEYIEKNYAAKLPVYRGSAGAYWEDGAASSARETTLCRNAEQRLASAAAMAALADRVAPAGKYPAPAIDAAWRNCLLYDEHTWGAHCSISQPDSDFTLAQWKIKAQYAVDAAGQAQQIQRAAAQALAAQIRTDGPALFVFNPAGWPRTDLVRVEMPQGMTVADPEVPVQATPDGTYVLVREVPSCGYRALKLAPRSGGDDLQTAPGDVIESRYYRVEFDPASGAIVSIRDKELGRELVDRKAPYQLNQYLYVAGGNNRTRIVMNPHNPPPALTITVAGHASLQRKRKPGVAEAMFVQSSGTMAPRIATMVHVWEKIKRIDIVNRFDKTQTYDKEAVYFAFPFAAQEPTFRYEVPAGIVNANRDMLPGACRDWFAVQDFVEVAARDAAVVWATPDAPLACFQDINRGRWLTELPMTNGHLYSYAMNNYWHTNYKAGQSGTHEFRFAITSRARADSAASARFGFEVARPLVGLAVSSNPHGPLVADSASLIAVAEPNVLLTGVKRSDDGQSLVVRLWELTGRATLAHLRLAPGLRATKATTCNLVEDPGDALSIHDGQLAVPVHGAGLATVRIE